jgi:peptide deformylase
LKIEYIDENNQKKILSTDGFTSRIIQHELDHLNGILFVDHLSRLKRDVIIRKMKKFKKEEKIV